MTSSSTTNAPREQVDAGTVRAEHNSLDALTTRIRELTERNEELENFADAITHDLRGPLSVVLGFGSLIQQRDVLPSQDAAREHLQELLSAASHMDALMTSLWTYTRLPKVSLQVVDVSLSELAEEVAERLQRTRYRARDITLVVEPALRTQADPRLLELLLEKLLDNAFRFTEPRLHTVVQVGGATHQGEPVFFVRDNGVGLDVTAATNLFAPFQARSSRPLSLGLATCARVVQRHKGRIWVESAPDKGTTLFFHFGPPQGPH